MEAIRVRNPKSQKSKEISEIEYEDDKIPVLDAQFLTDIAEDSAQTRTQHLVDNDEKISHTDPDFQEPSENDEKEVIAESVDEISPVQSAKETKVFQDVVKAKPLNPLAVPAETSPATSTARVLVKQNDAVSGRTKEQSLAVLAKESPSSRLLYPSLRESAKVNEVRPLSRAEIKMYFSNAEAGALEAITDQFIETNAVAAFVKHPLYIYLMEYLKALTAYENTIHDLHNALRSYEGSRDAVWKITDNRVAENSRCADNNRVTGEHHYRQCHMDQNALKELGNTLARIREFLYKTSFNHKCTSELARFQVEAFLYGVIRKNPITASVADSMGVIPHTGCIKLSETAELRVCIGILFSFHRIPLGSEKFREDIRLWLSGCGGVLVRYSTFYDQLFMMNQILRCPSPVIQWAASFLQISLPNSFTPKACNDPFVKHFVVMLRVLLLPVRAKNEFLSQIALDHLDSDDADSSWIVVDPDADGKDLTTASAADIQENDIFLLLAQFPFNRLFSTIFGSDFLDLEPFGAVAERDVLALFGFCHDLLDVLSEGLNNPVLNKYSRFNKKAAQIVRETVAHLKEFWERFIEVTVFPAITTASLKLQLEELVVRGFALLMQPDKNGTMQFLVGWPSSSLSVANIWRVICLMQDPNRDTAYHPDSKRWKAVLHELHHTDKLQERLQTLDEASATYFLTALSHVIENCDKTLLDLVETVTLEILRVSFLGPLRETYARTGRDIVAGICRKHPEITTEVLGFVRRNLDQIGSMAVFLFQQMPLKQWDIERPDLETVCEWLVNTDTIQDASNLLAREILSNLNWGFMEDGTLFLRANFHHYVAVAVVEAFLKFISSKRRRALLYESILRLSHMITTGKATPEQHFVGWCWEVLLDLRLHRLSQLRDALGLLRNNSVLDDDVPNLTKNLVNLGPLQAVEQRQPMACFVALLMTDVGHSTTGILDRGLDWTAALVENYLYVPALQVLEIVTPLFFANNQFVYLLQQDQFHMIVNGILQADATYVRMVKNLLVADFPGQTLKTFANMLLHQLIHAESNLPLAVRMWARVFVALKSWNRSREVLFVFDQIVKFAFYSNEMDILLAVVKEAYEELRQTRPVRGGGAMTSLVSWMTSGTNPAYVSVEISLLTEAPWFAYAIMRVEVESCLPLWMAIVEEVTEEKKRTFEDGVKKGAHKLDISAPAVTDLPIHRLAQLVVGVNPESEVFPILCQEFFKLFLRRGTNHASAGDQFLLSASGTKLLRPMKQKFKETVEIYKKKSTSSEQRHSHFYEDLQHAMNAFSFWMDEPKLHQPSLYLPSLPSEYEPELLANVLQAHSAPWFQFIDLQSMFAAMRSQAEHWIPFDAHPPRRHSTTLISPTRMVESALAPPNTYTHQPPFEPVDVNLLLDPARVVPLLRPDLTVIEGSAKAYSASVSEHVGLDNDFLEIIMEINSNVEREITVLVACRKGQCSGPAKIALKFREFVRNEAVYRAFLQNRENWTKVVAGAQNIGLKKLVTAIVRFEAAISELIRLFGNQHPGEKGKVNEVGAMLFYHILAYIGEETDEHPLVRKFFHSCVDVLGRYFIAHQPAQCTSLLETCLNNQKAVPMLLPHLTPNIVPNQFLGMYRRIQQVLQTNSNVILMHMLSTFDVSRWLSEPSVDINSRLELLSTIAYGINLLGATPSFQDYPLFEVYAQHVRSLLEFRFPAHLVDVLRMLLSLSEKNSIPPNGWFSCLFSVFGISFLPDMDLLDLHNFYAQIVEVQNGTNVVKIPLEIVLTVMDELSHRFSHARIATKNSRMYGLYPVWKNYVNSVTVLNLILGLSLVNAYMKPDEVFGKMCGLFAPWINVVHFENEDCPPWLQADTPYAQKMVSAFVMLASVLVEKHPGIFLNIWSWCNIGFFTGKPESYIISMVCTELLTLKWEKCIPNLLTIQQFQSVCERGRVEEESFLSNIFPKLPLSLAVAVIKQHESGNLIPFCMEMIRTISHFAVHADFRPAVDIVDRFVSEMAGFNWSIMNFSSLSHGIAAITRNPEAIASWSDGPVENAPVIRFLSLITEFNFDNISPNQDTMDKRAVFLHVFGRASVAWHSARNTASLIDFIQTVLKKAEDVWASAEPQMRYYGYLSLCSEVFSLSNFVTDKKVDSLLRDSLLIWIAQSPSSPLLIPMITACCRSVVILEHMAKFLEMLVVSYFRSTVNHGWDPVVAALEPPELSAAEFVKENLSQQNFLTLHAHFCRVTRTSTGNPNRRLDLFRGLIDWCKVRPLPEYEPKVFVLWETLLQTAETIDNATEVTMGMRSFAETVSGFAEQKGGFFSSLGVGKPTALSRMFKIVARSIATLVSPLTPSGRSSGKIATLANETRNSYEAMKGRKEYIQYGEVFAIVDGYIQLQGSLTWRDIRKLLIELLGMLYKQYNYLPTAVE